MISQLDSYNWVIGIQRFCVKGNSLRELMREEIVALDITISLKSAGLSD
jgi:hypothetical protein